MYIIAIYAMQEVKKTKSKWNSPEVAIHSCVWDKSYS